jgi:hypothetical protein
LTSDVFFGFELEGLLKGALEFKAAAIELSDYLDDFPALDGGDFKEDGSLTICDLNEANNIFMNFINSYLENYLEGEPNEN